MKNTKFEREELVFVAGSTLIFIWLCLRAAFVPLVYDETATFFIYILPKEFVPFYCYWDANNHILNSLLGICSSTLFGYSEFAMRLPNVLFFLLNIFFLFKLRIFFSNKVVWLMMALTLLFTHNVTEYSAYCRGYGLAISCLIGGIYYLLSYVVLSKKNSLIGISVFSFLGLAANFTLLNSVLLITFFAVVFGFIVKREKKYLLFFLAANLLFIAAATWLGFELKKRGLLYYGAQDGFYNVTLISLSTLISGWSNRLAPLIFIIPAGLIFIATITKAIKAKEIVVSPVYVFGFLLFGSIAAIFGLNIFFKVNFPEDRTALYLYPLFILFVFAGIDFVFNSRKGVQMSLVLFTIVFIHFIASMNVSYSAYWKHERLPESFYKEIVNRERENAAEVYISGYRMKTYIWNYYTFKNKIKLNEIYHEHFPSTKADYLIMEEYNYGLYNDVVKNYDVLIKDDYNNLRLLKNKDANDYKLIFDSTIAETKNVTSPYVILFEHKVQNNSFENVVAEFECNLSCDKESRIDFVFKALKGDETKGEAVCRTQWQRAHWISPNNKIKNRIFLENVLGADSLQLFISGKEGHQYKLENIRVKVLTF